jgi:hypothetical protein
VRLKSGIRFEDTFSLTVEVIIISTIGEVTSLAWRISSRSSWLLSRESTQSHYLIDLVFANKRAA